MKKSELQLLKVASKFQAKYGQGQSLQDAVSNAASYGPKVHGIINFPEQLKRDQATMSINVTSDGGTYTVSEPVIDPPNLAANYAGLNQQIKKYLEKYYSDAGNQDTTFRYSGVTPGPGIAQN